MKKQIQKGLTPDINSNSTNIKNEISKNQHIQTNKQSQDFQIKIQKIKKDISVITNDIEIMFLQNQFKETVTNSLKKQRLKLQNSFLFKNPKTKIVQSDQGHINDNNPKIHNIFRDINKTIQQYDIQIQNGFVETDSKLDSSQLSSETNLNSTNSGLTCQSQHLQFIFGYGKSKHQQKLKNLKMKRELLYEKLGIYLQKQQPYIWQKLVERIKRQAQHQARQGVLVQLSKFIQQNSIWMSQEASKVRNKLSEKQIQQSVVCNLQLMKRVMQKKVSNNDFVYQHYINGIDGKIVDSQKIDEQLKRVLAKVGEIRVQRELGIQKKKNGEKWTKWNINGNKGNKGNVEIEEDEMMEKFERLNNEIESLIISKYS